ncbi:MAG: aldehyde dehydrogenase family protein [Rhodoferax sp.]|nr:aldehyde dehydrogenase family protein [Rhodoferax sp.]
MSQLAIHNPANGHLITSVAADDASTVASKAARGRAAQPTWAATSLTARKACITAFRAGVVRDLESLAQTMTQETGKPIKMSRNELNGLLARLDFFLAEVEAALATQTVFAEGGMTEQIQHTPWQHDDFDVGTVLGLWAATSSCLRSRRAIPCSTNPRNTPR